MEENVKPDREERNGENEGSLKQAEKAVMKQKSGNNGRNVRD